MASRTYFSSTSNLMQCNCVKKGSSNQCVFHSNGKSIHVAGSTSVVGDTNVFFFRVSRTTGDHSCHKEQLYVGVYIYPVLIRWNHFPYHCRKINPVVLGIYSFKCACFNALWLNKLLLNIIGFTWYLINGQFPLTFLFSVSMDKMYLQVGERFFSSFGGFAINNALSVSVVSTLLSKWYNSNETGCWLYSYPLTFPTPRPYLTVVICEFPYSLLIRYFRL